MSLAIITILGTVFQLVAFLLALRLGKIAHRSPIWAVISMTLLLMLARRVVHLYGFFDQGPETFATHQVSEMIATLTSGLMVAMTLLLIPYLRRNRQHDLWLRQNFEMLQLATEGSEAGVWDMVPQAGDGFGDELYLSPRMKTDLRLQRVRADQLAEGLAGPGAPRRPGGSQPRLAGSPGGPGAALQCPLPHPPQG